MKNSAMNYERNPVTKSKKYRKTLEEIPGRISEKS